MLNTRKLAMLELLLATGGGFLAGAGCVFFLAGQAYDTTAVEACCSDQQTASMFSLQLTHTHPES